MVKLSLALHHLGKSPIVKRVMVGNYAQLLEQAKKLAARFNITEADWLRYDDGQDWIVIEDDQDLSFAYDFATSKCKKQTTSIVPAAGPNDSAQITFTIKPKVSAPVSSLVADQEMQEEAQPAKGH